ncbi:hypothetical protein ABEB36_011190 [Hypothenemus hampei]|uniref:Lipase domain-containing protein n=1 Tax=Hypothenemus hampei TaxID=57062 RepID=A0ABD1EF49_HYPHA
MKNSKNDLVQTPIMSKLILIALISVFSFANSAFVLNQAELTPEHYNSSRYILWENQDGLIEVEDFEAESANITLFATENDISFYIYTPENPLAGFQIRESQLHNIVRLTGFNIHRPTLLVVHGWNNNFESAVNDRIKNAVLIHNNVNVIVADWSPIANRNYLSAQGSVLAVGNYIGDFLLRLDREVNHRLQDVTVVGHSLGAHVSGNIGARTRGLIQHIIGLDPAGPLFTQGNINNRLDPTDGRFVEVIHTNDGFLGFGIRMGHVDYYPNGGSSQPGCGLDLVGSCAHSRAYYYYGESLFDNNFIARLCSTYRNYQNNQCNQNTSGNMGGYPVRQPRDNGEYYLITNSRSPFARG